MSTVIDHVIQGTVSNGDKIDFTKEKLNVQAFIKGQEVAQADVDPSGRYKLTFTSGEERPTTELRVLGAKAGESGSSLALTEILMPNQFATAGNQSTAQRNLNLPSGILIPSGPFNRVLPICGQVFAHIPPHKIEPQPGVRLDFYTFQPNAELRIIDGTTQPPLIRAVITWKKLHSYSSYTAPDGTYAGCFRYEIPMLPPLRPVPAPFFMVEISQFLNGNWNKVYSENITLSALQQDNHFDFLVPSGKLVLTPVITRPATGFRFGSIGLIPCDTDHLVRGYVYTKIGDPIADLAHRPLCGALRIFGLFASGSTAAKYKVEIAVTTDENYVPGASAGLKWETLIDPLRNLKWNTAKRLWEQQSLGPDPITHLYTNIDTEPEGDWLEHSLKFIWNSANKPDGFYILRITGFDKDSNALMVNGGPMVVEMPVLRIDNTLPQAELIAPDANVCGKVISPNGELNFNVTAHDPAGHVLSWDIRALAGRDAYALNGDPNNQSQPVEIQFNPPLNTGAPGDGILELTKETVTIVQLPSNLQGCDPLVYNFELLVQGSATNGYSSPQQVRKDVSLMVAKS